MAYNLPTELKYCKSDEWLRLEEDGDTVTVGITDYAQDMLNDIVYFELPEVGESYGPEESFGMVESVKAASDLVAHIQGTVTAVNSTLEDEPEIVNADPYGKGWIIRMRIDDISELESFMDASEYSEYLETR